MLVDEQIRGGVVQGIGAALYEECLYGPDGQLLNGNLADYLVPMSGEMCDIVCAHLETPTRQSQLGAKGVGEAGTAGAPAAVMNAINDALAPLGARVSAMPFTPERILKALGKAWRTPGFPPPSRTGRRASSRTACCSPTSRKSQARWSAGRIGGKPGARAPGCMRSSAGKACKAVIA